VSYQLYITKTAHKDIKRLDSVTKKRLKKKLEQFMAQPDPMHQAVQLKDPFDGSFRWRIGNYRVVFELVGESIYILRIQHRSEIYKTK
jgi:mRNA interferase RelE/StbE